ncbi:endolytic transglycosylase MltG [Neobacillus sp. SM06]|uniref:endolytic transglycosylase MltG n=1 Tax=Neobacillus sp. SM06 TaxID=3422492 RepID=UPI003D265193
MTIDGKKSKKELIQKKLIEQQMEARVVRRIVLIISLSILLAAALAAGGGYLYIKSALNPLKPGSKELKMVEIPIGSSATKIGQVLESKGIIKSATIFKYYVKLKNESGFMAGEYQFSPSMKVSEIVSRLKSGRLTEKPMVKITIPEGKQLKEIAHLMAKAIKKPDGEVFNQLNDKNYIKTLMAKYPNLLTSDIENTTVLYPLEGYLYPATYSFYKPAPSVDEIVTAMLDKTNDVISQYAEEIKQKQVSVHKLLTMASLIEEEATSKADRAKIASVFYNRIQKGMPLQTDPTILYAQGKHKDRVLYEDLKVNSPYNTYKNPGLPPGPIANAGRISIEAALNPAKTDYYYFLAAPDGSVIFTKTLAEHNQEKAKYISSKK